MITSNVDQFGYTIFRDDEPIYQAGNSRLESTTVVDPASRYAVDLGTLREYARQTMQEIEGEDHGSE